MAMNDHGSLLIRQETAQKIDDFVFKIERLIIFILILFSSLTPLCVVLLYLSNMFILTYCLFALMGLIISSLIRDCKFWLERIAMVLIAKQYLDPEFNYHYLAIAYFGLCNMLYLAQQKKFSQNCLLPASSFYGSKSTPGRTCYFGFKVAVFLLASLVFGTILNLVNGNVLLILVVSFAVPEILVNIIKPENIFHEFAYNTPKTLGTRILKSKDPEYLFWIERVPTILFLIAHNIKGIASTQFLAASLFAVTNTIYFINSIEFFLDIMINLYAVKNVVKAEVKDEYPLKEASKEIESLREEEKKRVAEKKDPAAIIKGNKLKAMLESEKTLIEDVGALKRHRDWIKVKIKNLRAEVKQLKLESEQNQKKILVLEQCNKKYLKVNLKNNKRLKAYLESEKILRAKYIEYLNLHEDEINAELENIRAEGRQINLMSVHDQSMILALEQYSLLKLELSKKANASQESDKAFLAEKIFVLERHQEKLKAYIENLRAEVRQLKSVSKHNQELILIAEQRSKDWVEEEKQLEAKIEELI